MEKTEQGFADEAHEHSVFYAARQALARHATGGNILIGATVLALLVANIPGINQYYFEFWTQEVRLQLGDFNVFSHAGHPMSLLSFINDALMAIFFFSIKASMALSPDSSSWARASSQSSRGTPRR